MLRAVNIEEFVNELGTKIYVSGVCRSGAVYLPTLFVFSILLLPFFSLHQWLNATILSSLPQKRTHIHQREVVGGRSL